jgi:hypothetical protein
MKIMSDEQIKAYLLGKLPEPEAEMLEIECASSAEFFAQAQAIESDLTDDYLRGNLSAADTRLYETNYLVTEARHKKLQFAASLWRIASELSPPKRPVVAAVPPATFWQTLFGQRRAFQLAFGGLILLFVFAAVAFFLQTSNVTRTDVAEVNDAGRSPKTENPPVQNPDSEPVQKPAEVIQNPKSVSTREVVQNKETVKDSNSPQKNPAELKTTAPQKNGGPSNPLMLMTVKLLPGSLRDEGEQNMTIAANVKNVKLLLSPGGEPNNYKIYRAVVRTPENDTVFTSPNLKALSFTIPAEKLENRTYIISLEGQNSQNEFESIADYTLRVRR